LKSLMSMTGMLKKVFYLSIFKGWWGDAGVSVDILLQVNNYVAKRKKENPHYWSFGNAGKSPAKSS